MTAARDPQQVRDKAEEILARPEFATERSPLRAIEDWLSDPFGELEEWFDGVLSAFFGANGPVAQTFAWVLAAIAVGLVVLLCVKLIRNTSRNDAVVDQPLLARTQSTRDLLAEAERYESQGEWRQAIRARHAALVGALSAQGVVRHRPGTTAREYAWQVSSNAPKAKPTFDEATTLFEWVWYGAKTPDSGDAAQFRDLSDQVRKAVRK